MHEQPIYTVWDIACRSSGDAQALKEWLVARIDLNRVFTDTVRTVPNGVERIQAVDHRLGDYFQQVRMLADPQNPTVFQLTFHRRPDAGRFWKDLMVNVLQEVGTSPLIKSISLRTKADVEPIAAMSVGESTDGTSNG